MNIRQGGGTFLGSLQYSKMSDVLRMEVQKMYVSMSITFLHVLHSESAGQITTLCVTMRFQYSILFMGIH